MYQALQKLLGAALCAALLTSAALAREAPAGKKVAGLQKPGEIRVDFWRLNSFNKN